MKNSELIAVSESPDHEVTPKNGIDTLSLLSFYITIFFVQSIGDGIDPFPQFLASHDLKTNLHVIKLKPGQSGKPNYVKMCQSVIFGSLTLS